jgi:hypothetical protein
MNTPAATLRAHERNFYLAMAVVLIDRSPDRPNRPVGSRDAAATAFRHDLGNRSDGRSAVGTARHQAVLQHFWPDCILTRWTGDFERRI